MSVSANQPITRQATRKSYPVAASTHIYEGAFCFINSSGYLVDVTATGINRFAGVAVKEVDNSGGSNGALNCEVYTEEAFLLTGSGFSQASVGLDLYATDNYATTTTPAAAGVRIGTVVSYVSATKVYAEIETDDARSNVSKVSVKTADFSVSAADSGRTFDSTGASATITASLPAATPGLKYRFRVGAAQQLRLDPNGTEVIALPSTGVAGAAGKYLVADAAGETIDIECVTAGVWSVFGYTGTWTAEA